MARDTLDNTPIEDRAELARYLAGGEKPREKFRIGTEHEKFAFTLEGHRPVPYEGESGIGAVLTRMQALTGWDPIEDRGHLIGLADPTGGGAISLEPGGQFELSGAPFETLHQTCREANGHLAQVRQIADELGISVSAAKVRLHRARRRLREQVFPLPGENPTGATIHAR